MKDVSCGRATFAIEVLPERGKYLGRENEKRDCHVIGRADTHRIMKKNRNVFLFNIQSRIKINLIYGLYRFCAFNKYMSAFSVWPSCARDTIRNPSNNGIAVLS